MAILLNSQLYCMFEILHNEIWWGRELNESSQQQLKVGIIVPIVYKGKTKNQVS